MPHRPPDPSQLTDAELEAELAAHLAAADRDALADPLTLARHLDARMVTRPHLRAASREIATLTPGGGGRLMIIMPPQVGKSQLAAIWGPFWWLAQHPALRCIIGCYASHLATKRGRSVRRLVQLHGHRYGLELEPATRAASDWSLTSGGGVLSAGVGAGITGNPADLGVIDDPFRGRADADSIRIRDRVWDWYSGDFYSRLSPGAPVMLMSTRWHDDDLAGRLLENEGAVHDGGRWQLVYLPALAMPDDADTAPDALDRAHGDPLTHPRIPTRDRVALAAHWADKRRSSTPRDWGALYQGDPKPVEGALISRAALRERHDYHPTAKPTKHGVAVDPSGGGRSTAGIVGGWLGTDGRLYLSHDRSDVMTSDQWPEEVCRLAAEIDADRVIIERNYGGDMAKRVIRSAWVGLLTAHNDARAQMGVCECGAPATRPRECRYTRVPPRLELVNSKKNKVLRAEPVAQQIVLDRIRFTAPMPELEDEWATWQPNRPDSPGRIDASVHLALQMLPIPGAGDLVSSPAGVSRAAAAGSGAAGMPSIPRTPRYGR